MRIEGKKRESNYVIKIYGQLTLEHEEEINQYFQNLLEKEEDLISGMRVQVNLSEVYYMDSVIIGKFASLKKRLENAGIEFDFLNTPEIVMKVFKMLSLDRIFNFFECPEWREDNE